MNRDNQNTEGKKMNDDQIKTLAEAINNLATAIKYTGDKIAEDEPLNYSVARGLDKISESIQGVRLTM